MLSDVAPLGLCQCNRVQIQIRAAGLERPSTEQVPALRLPLLIHFFKHLTQIRHPKVHLMYSQIANSKLIKMTSLKKTLQQYEKYR